MPQKAAYTQVLGSTYYHIYNRANNRLSLYYTHENYNLFLKLIFGYLEDCAEILAYCLIPNHFHLLIKTASKVKIENEDSIIEIDNQEAVGAYVSEQFRQLFIKYALIIKSQENIKGSVFQRPFKRVEIESQGQLLRTLFYIHNNPVKHNLHPDFKTYWFSSYRLLTSEMQTKIAKDHVLDIFGGVENLEQYHRVEWMIKKEHSLE
jgi:putative transposase